mgnify:CR=1 FL=1
MIETYSPLDSRVKTHEVVADYTPEFAITENPLLEDFLKQYYISQEHQGGVVDIAENIDKYIRIDNLTKEVIHGEVALASTITSTDTTLGIGTWSTKGFPKEWGLIKVGDEIITYTGITTNSFTGCVRGFSGITTYQSLHDPKNLTWEQSVAGNHPEETKIQNLSALFLKEVYTKLKGMYTPGLEGVPLSPELDVVNFIKEARSLYESKGTDESFKILFKALFGLEPKINDLEKYLIKPSYANYLRRESFAVELIDGDPENLRGQTLYQDNDPNNNNVNEASGPISEVVQIRDNYYRLSVFIGYDDRDLIQGTFVVPGRTQVIGEVGIGATVLTVDSTIGFGQTGTFDIGTTDSDEYQRVDYKEKTVNQFIGVTTTTKVVPSTTNLFTPTVVYGYENNDLTKRVNMRITGVLKEFDTNQDLYGLNPESRVKVKNLGRFITNPKITKTYEQVFFNSWVYNTSARYQIADLTGSTFTLDGYIDKSSLAVGDKIDLLVRNTETVQASDLEVTYVNEPNNSISVQGIFTTAPGISYDIRRKQKKATSSLIPIVGGQNQIVTDITNTYILDKNKSESTKTEAFVASNSLPSKTIDTDKIHAELINPTISGGNFQGYNTLTDKFTIVSFANPVPFRTGDEIVYISVEGDPIAGLEKDSYFVEVLSNTNQIKLYPSRSFIPSGIAVEFVPPKTTGTHDFVTIEQARKSIFPGRALKRFVMEQDLTAGREQKTTSERTLSGNTGMLVNGVELRNYKSDKSIYFGPLESLNVVNAGTGYDVLNPPQLTIEDNTTGVNTAFGRLSIGGTVTGVQIDPVEFEIEKVVSVDIHGGNGLGAKAQAVTELSYRTFEFNAKSFYNGGTLDHADNNDGRFILDKPHYYNNGDRVIYNANNNNPIGIATTNPVGIDTCLVEGQSYYIGITSATIFKLYRSKADSIAGVNTVGFGTTAALLNTGIHAFRDFETKRRISRVNILDGGSGYTNKRLSVDPAGISTARDYIEFDNHGFKDGEVVHYGISSTGGTVISGLTTNSQYQVLTLDENRFRLCYSGIATTRVPDPTNYNNKEYIRFATSGTDYQDFFYPPVTVDVNVITKVDQVTLNATPIVRGSIIDTVLYDKGLNYGSDILNFEKAPSVDLRFGRFGQIGLTIINGRVIDAFVQSRGVDYDGPPDITVVGTGTAFGCQLRAVMDGDGIGEVVVLSTGVGYTAGGTTVSVKSPGDAASFSTKVRRLATNQFETMHTGLSIKEGEYLGPVEDGLAVESLGYGVSTRQIFDDKEENGHSPIIGWAYDGIPIYGPWGFTDVDDSQSTAKRLESGYVLDANRVYNRPSLATWPAGSFIEDYYYNASGDLDEHNGRFAKTPDFPNGIYAYYATIDNTGQNANPVFPYYIGDTYRGFPIQVNTVSGEKIKQTTFDFENSQLVRNTFPYKMFGDGASYDFVYQPYRFISQVATPNKLNTGSVTNLNISSPGTGYTVGSNISFNNDDTGGSGASAWVSRLVGKPVRKLTTEFINYENTVFKWEANKVIGYVQPSHDLELLDNIVVAGLSTAVDKLTGSHTINNLKYSTKLLDDGFVGLVTDIRVQFIPESLSIGSTVGFGTTVGIGSETAHVLNVYKDDGVLRIRRSVGVGTTGQTGVGVSYYSDNYEVLINTDYFESEPHQKLYFNPSEAVGFGTTVGQTITRSYQYLGVTTDRSLLTQTIYLKNHGLKTNDTLEFTIPNGGSNISVATSAIYAGTFNLPSTVYAIRKTADTIGIKTTKTSEDLHFISGGTDAYDYLLEKQNTQITGKTQRITGKVQVTGDHELVDGDEVDLIVKPGLTTGIGTTTSVALQIIDDYLIVNPLNIAASGINTSNNRITSISHGLVTGDRVYYYGSNLPGGITSREYYTIRIDDDTLQLSNTLKQATAKKPEVIDITSQGGSGQTINPINPQIRPFRDNTVKFDLSHPSMSGYDLKFFYDTNFFNEFVGSGTSLGFEVVGVSTLATVGIASTAIDSEGHPTVKLSHSNATDRIYYNIFGPSGLSTADRTVINGNEIKFVDSNYKGTYNIISTASSEFTFNLKKAPEILAYDAEDCSELLYTTNSINATGGISTVNLVSGGFEYSRLPGIASISGNGINATLIPESTEINKLSQMKVPEDVYGYPSDNTLKPDAFIPRIIAIDDFGTIDSVNVTFGGKFYVNAPSLALYDKATGEILDNGLITCELSDSAVVSAEVSVAPIGLSNNDYGIAPLRNSNGISIMSVETDVGFLTCKISTPVLGYTVEPFAIGDKVLVEGISYDAGSGDGFNSGDYKFEPFVVSDYNDAVNPRQVTFDLNGISTNPGTGATVAFGFGQLVQDGFVARFEPVKGVSKFIQNEPFKKNDKADADIQLDFIDGNSAKIIVSGAEPIEVTDTLTGKLSGSQCRVIEITEFDGSFNLSSSVKTLVGWRDNIGIINDTNQVLPDNDYYQNMSYAIESPKTYEDLINYVNDIVHPSGMKNFANTEVMVEGKPGDTTQPADDAGGLVLDFIGDPMRVDAIYPFDLARDFLSVGNISKFVELRNTRLSDFILNKTNRVLNIDDISPQFVSNESNDLSDYRVVAQYPAGRYFQRFLTQTVYLDEDPLKNHYQINEFISITVDEDTFLMQKVEIKNYDQVGLQTGYAEFDTLYDPAVSKTRLIFRPNEPFDTNYDVKSLQTNFADSVGVGTTAFGHIRLDGGLAQAGAASTLGISSTTNIIGLSTTGTQAALIQFLVIDNPGAGSTVGKQVDYLEYALMHNGVDTYLTELGAFNTKQNLSGLSSPNFIGTFTSEIDSGVLKINFENGRQRPVNVKFKTVAIDPSTVGVSTNYRYKIPFTPDGTERSARLEVTSQAKSGISTIVGIASIRDLTVKSTVHVSYGATQSLHQVYLLSDPEKSQNFIQQYALASIGTTAGVGTFGSTYRPDGHLNLEFHPTVSGIVSITAYNEVLYRDADPNGTLDGIGQLNYGQVYESVAQNRYLGINNRDLKSFELKYRGTPIYARETNISDPSQLDYGFGRFDQEHFFMPFEQLTYKADSNLVGLAGTALVYYTGVGTARLPETVYAIKDNNRQFRVALSESDARAGLGVTFVPNSGSGNKHTFSMRKRDSKSMISLSGLVQKPISYTSISYDLDVPVAGFVTAFVLSGISSIQSGDLLKIEDEYSIVRTVGFGTTTIGPAVGIGTWSLVEVERGAVGTAATPHAAGETVRLFRGSFQILDSTIHFTQAPLGGDIGIINPENLPYARATFGGRTFLRNDYSKNQIFDDISESFDGLETTYALTSIGAAVTGIGTTGGNGVLFINNIFQAPYSENNVNANFKIVENAGIASVQFTGISSFGFTDPIIDIGDINENQLPRGGIIVSVASTPGRGYAPFLGAKVRAVTNSSGEIQSIVGVPTSGNKVAIQTAWYDEKTGIMEVSTVAPHGLDIETPVKVEGMQLECIGYKHIFRSAESNALIMGGDYVHTWAGGTATNAVNVQSGAESGNQKSPNGSTYDASTGVLTLSFASAHGMTTGDTITIDNNSLTYTCSRDNHATQHTYPRTTDPISGVTTGITTTSTTSFSLNVGISTLVYADVSDARYNALTGDMTLSIGSTAVGLVYANNNIVGIATSAIVMSCDKDGYATYHAYPRLADPFHNKTGTATTTADSITINVGKSGIGYGTTIGITSFVYDHVSGIATIIADGDHNFTDPNLIGIATGSLTFTCEMDGQYSNHVYPRASDPINDKFLEVRAVTPNTFDVFVGITTNVGWTPTDAVYDPVAGIMTMTIPNHNIMAGTSIKVKDNSLNFKCAMDGLTTSKSYPRVTDPVFDTAISVASTTATGIAITVGTSPTVQYSITTATYTPTTGFLDLNIGQHGLAEDTSIKLATGSLIFRCNKDSYISTHTYPRNTIDTQTVNGAVYDANAGIMTVTVVPGGRLIHDGDFIRFDNDSISFKCDMDGGTSTKTYPRSSDPVSGKWLPITGIGTTSFAVNVGKSPIAPYSISSAIYDPTAGIVTATIGDHNFTTGQSIQISPESMSFRCGLDTYQSLHYYPRSSDPGFTTAVSIASTTASTISFQVLASQPSTNISTHHFVPHEGLTAETGTQYDGAVGIMTVRSTNHGLSNGDWVLFETGAVSFTCAKDDYSTVHAYPRETDPYSGKWIQVSNVTTNTFRTNGMKSPDTSDHIFASGVTGAIKRSQIHGGGAYGHTFQAAGVGSMDQKRDRAYDQPIGIHSVGSTSHTATNAVYDPVAGIMTVTVAGHGFMNNDRVKFDTGAISLKCSRDAYRQAHAYPRVSDPIHGKWVSIASTTVNTFAVDVGKTGPNDQFDHAFHSAVTGGIKKQTGYITLQVGISTDTTEHRYDIMGGHQATNAVTAGGNYAHTFTGATTGAVQYGGNYAHSFVSAASSAIYIDSWSGAALTPTNAVYNPGTGVLQFTVPNHGLVKPENFKLAGVGVTCIYGAKTYPSGVQGYYYTVRSVGTTTSFTTFVGVSTLAHPYTGGGTVRVGLTTNIYPDYDQTLDVTGIISAKTFRMNAGISTIHHSYAAGGTIAPWHDLTFGSGYNQNSGVLEVCIHDYNGLGTDAHATATVGAGGTLIYDISAAGTLYSDTTTLDVADPNGYNLAITGSYREGLGNTTTTGVGASITVDIIGLSTNYVGYSTGDTFKLNEVYIWKMTKFGYGFKKGDKFNLVGLSTDPDAGDLFIPFEIEVVNIFNDDIASWQFGNIDYIDNIKPYQDGARLRYPLYYQDQLISFEIDNNDPDSREIDLAPVLMIFVNGVLQEPGVHYSFSGGTSVSFETAPTVEDDVFIFFYRGTVGNDSILYDVNEVIKIGDDLELFKSDELELNRVAINASNFAQQEERIVINIASASVVETPFYQGSGVNNDNYKPFRWNKQKQDKVFGGGIVSKARDTLEAQIVPTANVIAGVADTATEIFVDHTERFRDLDGNLTDDFGLFVYGVGVGTTATAGVNWEIWNDIDSQNSDVQGYAGVVTGITTSAGIGTDLGIVFQLDMNALVNSENTSYVQQFKEGYPFKLFGSGINPAAGVITSIDSHDTDPIGISTFDVDNIYYAHALSWDGSARTGVITSNIHSGTDVTGLVGVGSTAFPAARFTWGRFGAAVRDVGYPITIAQTGRNYNPDLDEFPIVKRTNIGLRNTGALGKTL